MFALIKREVRDNIVYFLGAVILAMAFIAILVSLFFYNEAGKLPRTALRACIFIGGFMLTFGSCCLGAAQMYSDRTKNISAFLSSRSVTRNQILIARIISGILVIAVVLVPLTVTTVAFMRLAVEPFLAEYYLSAYWHVYLMAFLMAFACYLLGMQTGWTSNKLTPTMGGLALVCLLLPLVIVKGFGLQIFVILVIFICASLVRVWSKFISTPL
ncbi:MAG: hypothetical protein JXB29_01910 [Sedimentisphaerales bacterium]|nr:hypothetical protein [Sedimentisphaerales bacterium]